LERLDRFALVGAVAEVVGEELRSPNLRLENLALRARAMTKRQTSHRPGKQFEQNDIVPLLRAAVEREGGQTAFAQCSASIAVASMGF
jgi:hypothetical protein